VNLDLSKVRFRFQNLNFSPNGLSHDFKLFRAVAVVNLTRGLPHGPNDRTHLASFSFSRRETLSLAFTKHGQHLNFGPFNPSQYDAITSYKQEDMEPRHARARLSSPWKPRASSPD
jgi:hypothetical protein